MKKMSNIMLILLSAAMILFNERILNVILDGVRLITTGTTAVPENLPVNVLTALVTLAVYVLATTTMVVRSCEIVAGALDR